MMMERTIWHSVHGVQKRRIGIRDLLVWAFRSECAQLDLGNEHLRLSGYGYASATAAIIQHEQLGCRIDGGGRSDPHPDADLVAAAVSVLPEGCGGRVMAMRIAELARADQEPDWMAGAAPGVYPVGTHTNRHGIHAVTADAKDLGWEGWPAQPRRNRKNVIVHDPVKYCPVMIRPTGEQISRARRAYLLWYAALLELKATFQIGRDLSAFEVTDEMPTCAPWRKKS